MAIDITNTAELKNLKLEDLVQDAVERGDKKALNFLKEQANSMVTRKRENGTTYEVHKSITAYRAEYLKKFCGYQPKSANAKNQAKKRKAEQKQTALDKLFDEAFAKL